MHLQEVPFVDTHLDPLSPGLTSPTFSPEASLHAHQPMVPAAGSSVWGHTASPAVPARGQLAATLLPAATVVIAATPGTPLSLRETITTGMSSINEVTGHGLPGASQVTSIWMSPPCYPQSREHPSRPLTEAHTLLGKPLRLVLPQSPRRAFRLAWPGTPPHWSSATAS